MLDPLAAIYGTVTRLRNRGYDAGIFASTGVNLPVVSVGNVVAGGSGKSPFTDFVCQQLLALEVKPVILMRGYGGCLAGPLVVDGSMSALQVGDEALMHWYHFRGRVPVVVSRRRVAGAELIQQQRLGNVIVLDDGFQHRALKRDLNLLLADVTGTTVDDYINSARLLPFGRFREDCRLALKRADAVIAVRRWPNLTPLYLTPLCETVVEGIRGEKNGRRGEGQEGSHTVAGNVPVWEFALEPAYFLEYTRKFAANDCGIDPVAGSVTRPATGSVASFESSRVAKEFEVRRLPLEALQGRAVAVLSGIATSGGFCRMLQQLGVCVVNEKHYGDHHQYRSGEVRELMASASLQSDVLPTAVLTTAKDGVKLLPTLQAGEQLWVLELQGRFQNSVDEQNFTSGLSALLRL